MTDSKSDATQLAKEILTKIRESQGRILFETRMLGIGKEVDRHFSQRHEVAMGVGVLVFDGKIRLSPVAGALLSLMETRNVPRSRWFDPGYPEMQIWAQSNRIDERKLVRALSKLLPASTIRATSRRCSLATIMKNLEEHGVPVSPELVKAFCNGIIEDIGDLLMALRADSSSNIALVQFTAAVMNPRKRGNYADGYVMRLTDAVTFYSSLEDLSRAGTELDLALSSRDEVRIESVLCGMIQEIFMHIQHPVARVFFAERLLGGQARETITRQTEDAVRACRPDLH